jgi:Mrp family chromosome partitioning ATPase
VSQALAHVLASERGNEVCWIDVGETGPPAAALGRGSIGELPGITTTLRDVQSDTALVKPDSSSIRLVPAGTPPPEKPGGRPRGGPDLDNLINGLAAEYRHIIFDTPPLLSRVDSIGFLRHAEAYLLVTRQGSTTLNQVRTIADELGPIPSLGAILNDHRTRTPRFVRRFFRE